MGKLPRPSRLCVWPAPHKCAIIKENKELMASQNKRPTELVDMASLMSFSGVDPLALSQIAGPGTGRVVRLPPLGELTLGRDDACDLILDEDAASRRHAKLHYLDNQPELLDLGSTNGTFLNGKQVHRAYLKHGDRIQVGTSVLEVVVGKPGSAARDDEANAAEAKKLQSLMQGTGSTEGTSPGQSSAIAGSLTEIRLTSLLQVIESDRGTGTLVIRQTGREGRIHLLQGRICHSTFGRARGLKALYRLMALEDGRFEFFIPGRSPDYETVSGELSKHLLEGMRQKDELLVYRKELPPHGVRLEFHPNKVLMPARVPPAALEVMAAIGQYKTVEKIIEFCSLPDFEVSRILLVLLKHGVVIQRRDS